MSDRYNELLNQAKGQLTPKQQQRLVEELSQHAARKNGSERHSILELEGLGAEIWKGTDPDEYVAKERDSWDG